MSKFKTAVMIIGATVIVAGGVHLYMQGDMTDTQASKVVTRKIPPVAREIPVVDNEIPAPPAENNTTGTLPAAGDNSATAGGGASPAITAKLRDEFGVLDIRRPGVQVDAIQALIATLARTYPDNWQAHVQENLRAAFPENADALYARFLALEDYKQWLETESAAIRSMSPEEQADVLWAKREQIFGDDAAVIWEQEYKERRVSQALKEMNQSETATLEDKLANYEATLSDIYGEGVTDYKAEHSQHAVDQFLSAESVQEDLRNMTPDQRRETLGDLRRSMGMDEESIERLAKVDRDREMKWLGGMSYMLRREQLTEGGELPPDSEELDELRKQIFGDEAETIRTEEQSGFYRYKEKQVFGQHE